MRKFLSLFTLSMVIFVAVGCGGNKNVNDEPVATVMPREHLEHWESWTEDSVKMVNNATVQEFDGNLMSCEYPEGWEFWFRDSYKEVLVSKKNPNGSSSDILIKFEINSFKTAEESVTGFADKYEGTPAELITYGDYEYYQTHFESDGMEQTMLVTMIDENKITITVQGDGHAKDKSVPAILNSIVYNL